MAYSYVICQHVTQIVSKCLHNTPCIAQMNTCSSYINSIMLLFKNMYIYTLS